MKPIYGCNLIFSANVPGQESPLASGVAPAREAESAGDMPEVPKGRGFAGPVCWDKFFVEMRRENDAVMIRAVHRGTVVWEHRLREPKDMANLILGKEPDASSTFILFGDLQSPYEWPKLFLHESCDSSQMSSSELKPKPHHQPPVQL